MPESRHTEDRWYAARIVARSKPQRLLAQPDGGFDGPVAVLSWLVEQALVERTTDSDGDDWFTGWGSSYCAVAGSRRDPWETREQEALDV